MTEGRVRIRVNLSPLEAQAIREYFWATAKASRGRLKRRERDAAVRGYHKISDALWDTGRR